MSNFIKRLLNIDEWHNPCRISVRKAQEDIEYIEKNLIKNLRYDVEAIKEYLKIKTEYQKEQHKAEKI